MTRRVSIAVLELRHSTPDGWTLLEHFVEVSWLGETWRSGAHVSHADAEITRVLLERAIGRAVVETAVDAPAGCSFARSSGCPGCDGGELE